MSLYTIEPLNGEHKRECFNCGNSALNRYLKEQASQDAKRYVSATFILRLNDSCDVVGYYTLCATSIYAKDFPTNILKKLPRYPLLPATLLGRLAVDEKYKGKNLGELLLFDALKKSADSSKQVASLAVIVDAKDNAASKFYAHYGFTSFVENENKLFMLISTISKLIH